VGKPFGKALKRFTPTLDKFFKALGNTGKVVFKKPKSIFFQLWVFSKLMGFFQAYGCFPKLKGVFPKLMGVFPLFP
jgi:hypothetical protein